MSSPKRQKTKDMRVSVKEHMQNLEDAARNGDINKLQIWNSRERFLEAIGFDLSQKEQFRILCDALKVEKYSWTHLIYSWHDMRANLLSKLLCVAAMHNQIETLIFLCSRGGKLYRRCPFIGLTPMEQAAYYGNLNAVRTLLRLGADVNGGEHTPMYMAAAGGHEKVVRFLWNNQRGLVREGCCLHIAAANGHVNVMKTLADLGAWMDMTDDNENTACHWAAEYNRVEAIEFLYKRGADVDHKNDYLLTPLHTAVEENNLDAVETLISLGADLNLDPKYYDVSLLAYYYAEVACGFAFRGKYYRNLGHQLLRGRVNQFAVGVKRDYECLLIFNTVAENNLIGHSEYNIVKSYLIPTKDYKVDEAAMELIRQLSEWPGGIEFLKK